MKYLTIFIFITDISVYSFPEDKLITKFILQKLRDFFAHHFTCPRGGSTISEVHIHLHALAGRMEGLKWMRVRHISCKWRHLTFTTGKRLITRTTTTTKQCTGLVIQTHKQTNALSLSLLHIQLHYDETQQNGNHILAFMCIKFTSGVIFFKPRCKRCHYSPAAVIQCCQKNINPYTHTHRT